MGRRFLLRLGFVALASALGATSCLSPTLPLPPPEVETVTQTDPAHWTITGTCSPGALVTVFNEATGRGVVYEDRTEAGTFVVELEAALCDPGWASQEHGSDSSGRAGFVIDELNPANPDGSGNCK